MKSRSTKLFLLDKTNPGNFQPFSGFTMFQTKAFFFKKNPSFYKAMLVEKYEYISGSKLNLKALTRTYGSINRNDRTIIFISVLECMKDVVLLSKNSFKINNLII